MNENSGLIHIYTGEGKGKTTAAIGLAVRAFGANFRVLVAQFLKGVPSAETDILRQIGIDLYRTDPVVKFYSQMNKEEQETCRSSCCDLFELAVNATKAGTYDMIVLDEITAVLQLGILQAEELNDLLDSRGRTEVVITGRNAPQWLYDAADYVSEIKEIKHPYSKGIMARKGIEY